MKLNVERIKRYRIRTLPRPDSSITLSPQELDDMARWEDACRLGWEPGDDIPRAFEWRDQVDRYCQAKGLRPTFMRLEHPRRFGSVTFSWEPVQ